MGGKPGAGALRTTAVRAGRTRFCPAEEVPQELGRFCELLNALLGGALGSRGSGEGGAALVSPWCERESKKRPGVKYYFNASTGQSVWDEPASHRAAEEAAAAAAAAPAAALVSVSAEGTIFFLSAAALFGLNNLHPFQDGNGRVARVLLNYVMARLHCPFTLSLCPTPVQRRAYSAAIVATRAKATLAPLQELILSASVQCWEECERQRAERAAAAAESAAERSARAAVTLARAAARESGCMICLDAAPNITTLCCGAAVHFNCLGQWLANCASASCVQCRAELPRPLARDAGAEGGGGGGSGGGGMDEYVPDDTDDTEESETSDTSGTQTESEDE